MHKIPNDGILLSYGRDDDRLFFEKRKLCGKAETQRPMAVFCGRRKSFYAGRISDAVYGADPGFFL